MVHHIQAQCMELAQPFFALWAEVAGSSGGLFIRFILEEVEARRQRRLERSNMQPPSVILSPLMPCRRAKIEETGGKGASLRKRPCHGSSFTLNIFACLGVDSTRYFRHKARGGWGHSRLSPQK